MEWLWTALIAIPVFAFAFRPHDPFEIRRARRLAEKRRKRREGESLDDILKRVQEADYVIPTGAGSICGTLPSIKTQEDADRVLARILKNVEEA